MDEWVETEFQNLNLGDRRLNRRLRKVLAERVKHPSLSIPASTEATANATRESEIDAVYRLLDNPRVDDHLILQPHYQRARERVARQPVALVIQDTTEIDLTRPREVMTGVGPLGSRAEARVGAFCHVLYAITPEGEPLGLLPGEIWTRDPDDPKAFLNAEKRRVIRRRASFHDKESLRWVEGYVAACSLAAAAPDATVVCVSDSESDIYEYLAQAGGAAIRARVIVRACQNRALAVDKDKRDADDYLLAAAAASPLLGRRSLEVRERGALSGDERKRKAARSERRAECEIRGGAVVIQGPMGATPIHLNVVLVREMNPPPGEPPIDWVLITDLSTATLDDATRVVDYYCARWHVEVYFKVLKSGCRIEASQLETFARFRNFLALMMVAAYRLHHLTMLGRTNPELSCDAVLSEYEWKAACAVARGGRPPEKPPSIGEMVKIIGEFGGWINRKNGGPPGVKSLWIGLQCVTQFAAGYRAGVEGRPFPSPAGRRLRQDS